MGAKKMDAKRMIIITHAMDVKRIIIITQQILDQPYIVFFFN